jgi:hypothetical protein
MLFSRHGDILTVTGRVDDPVYLTAPLYVSKEWTLAAGAPGNRAVRNLNALEDSLKVIEDFLAK